MSRLIFLPILLLTLVLANCASDRVANKEKVDALRQMGSYKVREGNLREGLAHLLEAAELDPNNPDLYHEIGRVYREMGKYDLSLQNFQKALRLRPDFPDVQNDLGTLYALMERYDLAIEYFQKAVDNLLYKTPDIAYNNMGRVYYKTGDYQKAINYYLRAIKAFPNYATYHSNLGFAYEAVNRWDNAIEAYRESIRINTEYTIPYLRLGNIYYDLRMKKEARDILERLLALDKEGPHTLEAKKILIKLDDR